MTKAPVTRHEGEYSVQERIFGPGTARTFSHAVGTGLPRGAFSFIENLSMAVIGSRDARGNVWASILFGEPGFLHAVDVNTIDIDATLPPWSPHDPLLTNLAAQSTAGLLLIDFASRQRLRINGTMVPSALSNHWIVHVEQAYPNCPRYIQRRICHVTGVSPSTDNVINCGTRFTDAQLQAIGGYDTFFVASAHPQYGVDASHRGGAPGFVRALSDTCLRIPDYAGNNMFNTLGNIFSEPHVGLIFLDFERQRLLQCTGIAEIIWHLDARTQETTATQRYWIFRLETWREYRMPHEFQCDFVEHSPFNP